MPDRSSASLQLLLLLCEKLDKSGSSKSLRNISCIILLSHSVGKVLKLVKKDYSHKLAAVFI